MKIEHCEVQESIKIGDLFEKIGFSSNGEESFLQNISWDLDILSEGGYFPVEGFRWTKPENQIKVSHKSLSKDSCAYLVCATEHLIFAKKNGSLEFSWEKAETLAPGDIISCLSQERVVVSAETLEEVEPLCDLQVGFCHSYYADGVLSHNSHFLVHLGSSALLNGVNVLHYTFELNESSIGIRYDSHLCDIDSNQVIENKDSILEKYKNMKNLGKLIIKEFPTNTATVYTLRSHIERLKSKGFVPGLIIIDYADIMRSTRQFDSLRHELKLIYEELRGLASELQIPIWTASQSNKEGSNSDIVDLNNMGEAYGKAQVADFVAGLSRKSQEKANGSGRLYVAKNRAGRDGLIFPIRIDTARSKFEILGEHQGFENNEKEKENDFKRSLREKWKELKNDEAFKIE